MNKQTGQGLVLVLVGILVIIASADQSIDLNTFSQIISTLKFTQ